MLDLIRAVARQAMAYPFKIWGYGEGIALEALISAGEDLGDPAMLEFVDGLMVRWLTERKELPYTDHVAPGKALLMIYERMGRPELLGRARALADLFTRFPKTQQGARLHRPDHPEFSSFVYVDCMDFDAPFLTLLGKITGEETYMDMAVDCLLAHARVLWDDQKHLFYHLYDARRDKTNGAFWGRGNGWAALGTIATLETLPREHPAYSEIAQLFREHMAALVAWQGEDGNWHTVLDRPDTYPESSLPAMFYCALARGRRLGLLAPALVPAARRAWEAMHRRLDANGILQGVSFATPPGNAEHYASIPVGANCPWGQGPALEALLIGELDG